MTFDPSCHDHPLKRNKYHLPRTLQKTMKIKVDVTCEQSLYSIIMVGFKILKDRFSLRSVLLFTGLLTLSADSSFHFDLS